MDHSFLVGVVDGPAHLGEQIKPLTAPQPVAIAVFGDRDSRHVLHDEVGPPGFARPRIQHARDIGMIHERQRLPLGLETCDDFTGVHPELDDFKRHPAVDGLALLGEVDGTHAALAQ